MTKSQFVRAVAARTGYPIKDTEQVIRVMEDVIIETVPYEEVRFLNNLTLAPKYRPPRNRYDVKTRGIVVTSGHMVPECKIGKAIKEAVAAVKPPVEAESEEEEEEE